MPEVGTTSGFEEVALTVSEPTGVSLSLTVKGIAGVEEFLFTTRSISGLMVGGTVRVGHRLGQAAETTLEERALQLLVDAHRR